MGKKLYGLKEIGVCVGRSPNAVRRMVVCHGLPAYKVVGRWEADVDSIEEWRRRWRDRQRVDGDDGSSVWME